MISVPILTAVDEYASRYYRPIPLSLTTLLFLPLCFGILFVLGAVFLYGTYRHFSANGRRALPLLISFIGLLVSAAIYALPYINYFYNGYQLPIALQAMLAAGWLISLFYAIYLCTKYKES